MSAQIQHPTSNIQHSMLVLPLDAPSMTLAEAGGKCINLNSMIRAGWPTPGGFVITTAAYREFVAANGLANQIVAHTAGLDANAIAGYEAASAAIRQLFEQGEMAPTLAAAILQGYAALPATAEAVAVRSSATAEDLPSASFAGQQETYLNVRGAAALLTAVKKCWSSLWTARALAYRQRQGIAPDQVALAVAVQIMVPAQAAGVLFTINPVSGAASEIVVNATWGLGEALVSGQVNPDTIVLDKATGAIKSSQLGDKAVMTATDAEGVTTVAVSADQQTRLAVTATHLHELARLGREIETHFGVAQDIEWAVANDQVYILQARPVTTQPAVGVPGDDAWWPLVNPAPQPYDLWTQNDVGERWPDPVTPFTWSTAYSMIAENMGETFGAIKDRNYKEEIIWARRMFGRVYLNEGALVHATCDGFGMPSSMMASGLTNLGLITPENDRYRWGRVWRTLPILWRMMSSTNKRLAQFEQEFAQIERWVDEFMQRDLSSVSDQELYRESMELWLRRGMHYMSYHGLATSQSMMSYSSMGAFLKKQLGKEELVNPLVGGLTGVISAEIVPSLWEMAATLRRLGLDGIVREQEATAALAQLRTAPTAQPFLEQLEAFLQRHGHRCATEAEWLYPRWREAPEQVIAQLAGYLKTEQPFDAASAEARQLAQRAAAIQQVEQRVNPLQRAYFHWGLKRLQHLVRLRDNGQHFLVKLLLPMRRLLATLGKRWAARGWLAQADDFFFLVLPEVEQVVSAGQPDRDLKTVVAQRRLAFDYWRRQPLYDTVDAQGQPVLPPVDEANVITGIAASTGRITGTARVVMTPQEASRLQPGEILVTRATDPGWTPVFAIVGAVVIEIGGQLSHGAIVAREYGLPAVINASGATQRIRDGQQITVDGTLGRVVLGD